MRQTFSKCCAIFCTFSPLTTWKIKILKLKKIPGHIILHICTINDNHDICFLRYGAWSTQFFVILDHFLHFYPLPTLNPPPPPAPPYPPKNKKKIWKNEKTSWRYYHFTNVHMCTINNNHLIYGSWDIECIGQNFFAHLPPKHPNFEKMNKMPGDSSNPSKLRFGSYFHYSLVNFENLIILFGTYGLFIGFKLGKKSSFTKISDRSEDKSLRQVKNCLGFEKYWFEKTFDT